jgi:hypothetical protein
MQGGIRADWNSGRDFAMTAVVCLIQPRGYVHSLALLEVCQLLAAAFESLGWRARLTVNQLQAEALNVVLGYHLLTPEDAALFAGRQVVVYQLEQATQRGQWLTAGRLALLRAASAVWDYSPENIALLRRSGISRVRELKLGYHPALRKIAQRPESEKDIDALFYGSLNERRARLLGALKKRCHVKTLFGVYGEERDGWIARSRIVLNIHHYPSKILEQVRLSYLLNNECFVISEESQQNPFSDGIVAAPYERLAAECERYLPDPQARCAVAARGFRLIEQRPMTAELAPLLEEWAEFAPARAAAQELRFR